jgi:hypothetical protein
MNDRIESRRHCYLAQRISKGRPKLDTEPRTFCLIQVEGVLDIGLRSRPNQNGLHSCRPRNRPRTSSAGVPIGPSRSISSSRRSSSSRWASVSGTASWVDARLSHRRSRRSSFSSRVSPSMSITDLASPAAVLAVLYCRRCERRSLTPVHQGCRRPSAHHLGRADSLLDAARRDRGELLRSSAICAGAQPRTGHAAQSDSLLRPRARAGRPRSQ